ARQLPARPRRTRIRADRHRVAFRPEPAADLRVGVCAGRVEHGRALARRADHRNSARDPDGAQRIRRLFAARTAEGLAGSEIVHDCHLRVVRLRKLQLDRNPDRRHWGAGAQPRARPGAARSPRDVRRHAGELHDRDDRRVFVVRTVALINEPQSSQSTLKVLKPDTGGLVLSSLWSSWSLCFSVVTYSRWTTSTKSKEP